MNETHRESANGAVAEAMALLEKDILLAAARRVALELDPDPPHSLQVYLNAHALFCFTAALHGLGEHEGRLLGAGALLHDVGYSVSAQRHHKHSRDVILRLELPGAEPQDLLAIACLARYHRKAPPSDTHRVFGGFDLALRQTIRRLAAILRLADGLDRSHCSATVVTGVTHLSGEVRILVHQQRQNPTDLLGAAAKRALFEQAFRVRLTFG